MATWKKISKKEYEQIREEIKDCATLKREYGFSDFEEVYWTSKYTGDQFLMKTIQENSDEVQDYPPTVCYYKNVELNLGGNYYGLH